MKNKWINLVTRKESPLWVSLVCNGGKKKYYKNSLGWEYSIKEYKYSHFTHSISTTDAIKMQEIIESELNSSDFFSNYLKNCENAINRLEQVTDKILSDFTENRIESKADFYKLFNVYCEATLLAIPFLASFVLVQNKLETELRSHLSIVLQVPFYHQKITDIVNQCVLNTRKTSVQNEYRSLLEISTYLKNRGVKASDIKDSVTETLKILNRKAPKFPGFISQHIDRYGWLRTFAYLGDPFDKEELISRLKINLNIDPQNKLRNIDRADKSATKKVNEIIDQINLDVTGQSLLDLAGKYLFWRFERIDSHFKAEVKIRGFFKGLAESIGISRTELIYLTKHEISSLLKSDSAISKNDKKLTDRMYKGFLCTVKDEKYRIRIEEPRQVRSEKPNSSKKTEWPIKGVTACKGYIEGKARIVYSSSDIHNFIEGEILVASMTTPDLMLAIQKCSAIVTDEGGITCHAAIISRELQVPCIIGTEFATDLIENGQHLIVNAKQSEGYINKRTK